MPMVRRGNGDGIDIFAFEKLADVLVRFDGDTFVVPLLLFFSQDGVIDVAQAGDAAAFDLGEPADVIGPAPAEPDGGETDIIIGAPDLGPRFGRPTDRGSGGG